MKKIEDSSFNKIKEYKKYKDIYDFSTVECRVALLAMIILDAIYVYCTKICEIKINILYSDYISYLDTIGIAFIGFLGFIVTGLAILTGAISSAVVKKFQDNGKLIPLERILLSFYLLGLISGFIIILAFLFHFLDNIFTIVSWQTGLLILSSISYLVVFSIFYAVKLIGNCLELFFIVSDLQIVEDSKNNILFNPKYEYDRYRIISLEKIILNKKTQDHLKEYAYEIKNMIESDTIPQQVKDAILLCHKDHFKDLYNNQDI